MSSDVLRKAVSGHSDMKGRVTTRLTCAEFYRVSLPAQSCACRQSSSLLRRSTNVETRSSLRSVPRFSNVCKESGTSDTSGCDNLTASTNVVIFDVTVCLQQPRSIPVLRLCLNSVGSESLSPSSHFPSHIVDDEEWPVNSIKIAGFIGHCIGMMHACRLVIGERLVEV